MCDDHPYDAALYSSIRNTLKCVVKGLTSAECVALASASVLGIVHRAIADFHAGWNDSTPHLLSPLPTELRAACFQWLSFRDRVTLSHVSRGLRKMMLENPALWDSVPASFMTYESAIKLYREVLARSGSVGLDVRCPIAYWAPPEVEGLNDLLRDTMQRIWRLEIGPYGQVLQQQSS